jgi:hypothetical protein
MSSYTEGWPKVLPTKASVSAGDPERAWNASREARK